MKRRRQHRAHRASRDRRGGRGGFTLIEMLVALTLIGLLSAGLFAGLRFGARAWEAGGERISATNDIEAARGFLRRRLAQIKPLSMRTDGRPAPVFDGRAESLRFAASWPVHLGHGGVFVFDLRAAGGDPPALSLDWALYRSDGPVIVAEGRERPRRIFQGAETVRFRYFGQRPGTDEARWHDDWFESDRLPSLIEIDVTGGKLDAWPPIRVAVAGAR